MSGLLRFCLRLSGRATIFDFMKSVFAICLTAASLVSLPLAHGDDLERKENDERFNRLSGRLDDLEDAYKAQNKRMGTMAEDVNTVLRAMREEQNKMSTTFVTHEELKKLYEKLQEIDQKREADKKLILEEIKEIQKLIAKAPVPPPTVIRDAPEPKETKNDGPAEYFPYTVQENDNLTAIIAAYNKRFKEDGKKTITFDQVKKANPGMNPNRLLVGHEIKIPAPPSK
ncbi:MAG: Peptidoglycan-binding LysM [Verrucomicrobiales bacterium]|nr:Peptidoglycan-binding LysM [Verrucomicrobiales bacterium]